MRGEKENPIKKRTSRRSGTHKMQDRNPVQTPKLGIERRHFTKDLNGDHRNGKKEKNRPTKTKKEMK